MKENSGPTKFTKRKKTVNNESLKREVHNEKENSVQEKFTNYYKKQSTRTNSHKNLKKNQMSSHKKENSETEIFTTELKL